MKAFWTTTFLLLTFIFTFMTPSPVQAQAFVNCATERCADCDVCGYCRIPRSPAKPGQPTPVQVPGNWLQCQQCLYPKLPNISSSVMNAKWNLTLRIDNNPSSPTYNLQVTPIPGRYYTQLGCISTDLGDFSNRETQGSVVNFVLRAIFNVSGGIAFLYLIYGAYVIMTGRGDPMRLNQGRSIIFGAVFGLIFVVLSTLILNLVVGDILKIPGFS